MIVVLIFSRTAVSLLPNGLGRIPTHDRGVSQFPAFKIWAAVSVSSANI
jgi:hypothetical protein